MALHVRSTVRIMREPRALTLALTRSLGEGTGYLCVSESTQSVEMVTLALLVVLLAAVHVELCTALSVSRDTTLATFNTGLLTGTIGNIDSRTSVLIDQVALLLSCYA